MLLVLCDGDGDESVRGAALGVYGNLSKTDVCVRCNLKFDQDNNSAEACCYHTDKIGCFTCSPHSGAPDSL